MRACFHRWIKFSLCPYPRLSMRRRRFLPSSIQRRELVRSGTDPLPRVGANYRYVALRFHPDGSTDLLPTAGPWFLTLHDEVQGDGLAQPPANFSTIEMDPVNGSLKFFRPGL